MFNLQLFLWELGKSECKRLKLRFKNLRGSEDNPNIKESYYREKWGASSKARVLSSVADYVAGLAWVLRYYYHGCPSWSWYYPGYYAPFPSDIAMGLLQLGLGAVKFCLDAPLRPMAQLLAVLPPQSAHALPACYQDLVASPDSPLADFYPLTFKMDMENQPCEWRGVALLPFIDVPRLLAAMRPRQAQLTPEERIRDRLCENCEVYAHSSTVLGRRITAFHTVLKLVDTRERELVLELSAQDMRGVPGELQLSSHDVTSGHFGGSLFAVDGRKNMEEHKCVGCYYSPPKMRHKHLSVLLNGAHEPPLESVLESTHLRE
jgi:5'-3' exoribonuclease 2